MKIDICRNYNGDWIGLYVDGELKLEGHSLQITDVIEALGIDIPRTLEVDLWNLGCCPKTWDEVEELHKQPRIAHED